MFRFVLRRWSRDAADGRTNDRLGDRKSVVGMLAVGCSRRLNFSVADEDQARWREEMGEQRPGEVFADGDIDRSRQRKHCVMKVDAGVRIASRDAARRKIDCIPNVKPDEVANFPHGAVTTQVFRDSL